MLKRRLQRRIQLAYNRATFRQEAVIAAPADRQRVSG